MSDTQLSTPPVPEAIGTITGRTSSPPQFTAMVNSACVLIFDRWRPHVGEAAARVEAERFARRFHHLIDGPLAPLTAAEADAVLADVADAMAAS